MDEKVTLTAHRGYRAEYPENTMTAFREALKLDVDSIEMDVHMTKDREIVVIHDADLRRTTDKEGLVRNMTLAQVREADAGIKTGERFKGEKVPTLDEFLALMATRPDISLLLELKDYPEEVGDFAYVSCEKTVDLLKKYGIWGRDRLTIVCFSTGICAWLKTRYPFDETVIHGFWPKYMMRGWEKDDPYKYLDEVCLFHDNRTVDGRNIPAPDPVADKCYFDDFKDMKIKPCVYFRFDNDAEHYRKALANGAIGITSDDAYTCGKILDELGARKLKK